MCFGNDPVFLYPPNETVFRFVTRRYTPLHWASQKGHTHTVRALLAAGASVHVVSVPRGRGRGEG